MLQSRNKLRFSNTLKLYRHHGYGGQQSMLVILDGYTIRGKMPKGKTQGVHLLAVYLPEEGFILI
jgi:hypothetical protein